MKDFFFLIATDIQTKTIFGREIKLKSNKVAIILNNDIRYRIITHFLDFEAVTKMQLQ